MTMDITQRLEIEAQCTRLINHYANLNDAQDWDAVAELYTEDARFGRPSKPGDLVTGREAILASFKARPPRAQRHVIANVVVDVEDADSARAFSVILLFQGEAAAEGELPAMSANSPLVGTFRDRIVRTNEGWQFAERIGGLDFRP
ncbi:nuclear transport factor 2 family protein [Altericroceibacterium xinjiangense]|uniref:nuclear transport factor 2 family protein n=1 Tax=Altericroceibacterium xinjiangense TaxID=762261 RepID=UPI000F7EE052|nr:nuclear transport factor 2 family protein [Altericroceibacterium xinjiangense]